jgi:outer membrane protein insertion porin family/translocation and assembly module TamA
LREPFFLSRRTSAAITLGAERFTEFQAYLQESVGGELSFSWRTPVDVPVTLSYSLSRARTEADPATFCAFLDVCLLEDTRVFTERRTRATIGLGFVWDRTDSPTSATRGTRLTGEFRHASDNIGSDALIQFNRGVMEFASFHPVSRRSVFAWRVRVGAVGTPRDTEYISPEDRLYGGGPNGVRGYGQNELGPLVRVLEPVESTGQEVDSIVRRSATGGDRLLLASAELRVPLPGFARRVFGAVFVDAGQVTEHRSDEESAIDPGESLTDLKVTPGVGFRVLTALGPMRLDVGFNPYEPRASAFYRESDGTLTTEGLPNPYTPEVEGFLSRLRLHFSVGQAF